MNRCRRDITLPDWLPDTKLWACKDTTLRAFITLLFTMDDEGQVLIEGPYAPDIARLARVSEEDFQNALAELESIKNIERLKSDVLNEQIQIVDWEQFLTDLDFGELPNRPQKTGLPEAT